MGESWKFPNNQTVLYCLSEMVEGKCSLQFDKLIMSVVIFCNAVKLASMLAVVFLGRLDAEQPILTVGDAVASFMERPVPRRKFRHKALLSRGDLEKWYSRRPTEPRRWINGVGIITFLSAYAIPIVGLIIAIHFAILGLGTMNDQLEGESWSKLPFGSVDLRAVVVRPDFSLLTFVVIANTPQLILSISYFAYNRLYTSMLLSSEYISYSLHRKPLRVSRPRGFQRSNYFLSLPYRWSIALMFASSILHWLFSQSIFLVRIQLLFPDGSPASTDEYPGGYTNGLGYSPIPILLSIVLSIAMLATGFAVSMRKYKGHMPLAGSNTLAISAACHPPPNEVDGHLRPVQWGEVLETVDLREGHCAFTSLGTVPIKSGRGYI